MLFILDQELMVVESQALAERETESKELRFNISELEANTNDLHAKFEATLQHLEKEAEERDAELEAANREIEKLGEQVYLLEVENDRIKEEHERMREDEAVERERLEALAVALKDVSDAHDSPSAGINSIVFIESKHSQDSAPGSARPVRPNMCRHPCA